MKHGFGLALLLGGLAVIVLPAVPAASAQAKNEIGLVLGAAVTPSQRVNGTIPGGRITFEPSVFLGAEYDRLILERKRVAVYVGADFEGYPRDVRVSSGPPNTIRVYRLLFLTPKVRVKFAPNAKMSPWLAFGGGYARFAESSRTLGGATSGLSGGTNTGTLTFAGGVDILTPLKIVVPIGLRVEVRDYFSGKPRYNVNTGGGLQHTVAFAGGLVLHF